MPGATSEERFSGYIMGTYIEVLSYLYPQLRVGLECLEPLELVPSDSEQPHAFVHCFT